MKQKVASMAEHNLLIKRPVIEFGKDFDNIIVGYNEDNYSQLI